MNPFPLVNQSIHPYMDAYMAADTWQNIEVQKYERYCMFLYFFGLQLFKKLCNGLFKEN